MPRAPWKRPLAFCLAILLGLLGSLWVACAMQGLPDPVFLARLELTPRSEVGSLFPSRLIPASPHPRPLTRQDQPWPDEVPWKGDLIPTIEFLERTRANAFLALHRGVLVWEWYGPGITAETSLSSWSVAKSIVSLMAGQSIAAGHMHEDDRLVDLVPDLRKAGADPRITVRELLDMTSGVAVAETYDPWRFWQGTAGMYLTRDLTAFIKDHVGLEFTPGTRGEYRSIDTQLLGAALVAVEHQPLAALLSHQVWTPMGAEQAARWNLDRPGGMEKAFCCINAVARDFARIGQLVLDHGRVGEVQVVPAVWIDRVARPANLPVDGLGYSAQWWQVPGPDDDVAAVGVYGQYVYVNRDKGVVIVKLSDYGAEQDELDTLEVLRIPADWWARPPKS
jgi:CubicO group peptidase (beta-lactamase class C family)